MLINFEQLPIPKKIDFESWCTLQQVLSANICQIMWGQHQILKWKNLERMYDTMMP